MADWWDTFSTRAGNMLIGPQTFGAMIGRLATIAEANPEIRDETLRLRDQLMSASPTGQGR